ncbi:hypothetical protein F5Y16DRAFT_399054 [Xylariaceae sp. FL0255]|nr:hypothetical protein F5Y16DRAFT_399054 [Xylariaceae sp. FL0255]
MKLLQPIHLLVTSAVFVPNVSAGIFYKFLRQASGGGGSSGAGSGSNMNNSMDLILCSNPDFEGTCETLTGLVVGGGYGPPPCSADKELYVCVRIDPVPEDLHVGPPQGVSSARSYSGWNCTLYE